MNLKNLGLEELSISEKQNFSGGYMSYWQTSWSGTGNALVFACEAAYNGIVLLQNGVAWCVNHF